MKRITIILALTLSCQLAPADDWPEWRGRGSLGVWKETGILDAFPKEGLAVKWRNTDRRGSGSMLLICRVRTAPIPSITTSSSLVEYASQQEGDRRCGLGAFETRCRRLPLVYN